MTELLEISKIFTVPAEPVEYQKARVYIVIQNKSSSTDFFGKVFFECNEKSFGYEQVVSVFKGDNDGVWFDDTISVGGYNNCKIKVNDTFNKNIITSEKGFEADKDTDKDGIGNKKDIDDDNDSISDIEEMRLGLNALSADTDHDGFDDAIDTAPKDKNIFRLEEKKMEIKNNVTPIINLPEGVKNKYDDTDKDGITDYKEVTVTKTDPNKKDTDNDDLEDGIEIKNNTSATSSDTDKDGRLDKEDIFPTDKNNEDGDIDGDNIKNGEELKNKLSPTKKNTYIIEDKYSLHIIKYIWFYVSGFIVSWLFLSFIKYKIYVKNRKRLKLDK